MSLAEFARATSQSIDEARSLLHGDVSITLALARALNRTIGGSPEFWMSRDFQFREDGERIEDEQRDWLKLLPAEEVGGFGWATVPARTGDTAGWLHFFGVQSVQAWQRHYANLVRNTAFRSSPSFQSSLGALASWLRQGEIEGSQIDCAAWRPSEFRRLLAEVRTLTKLRDPNRFLPRLQTTCAAAGVAVVVVRAPRGCRASGATRFLAPEKALVQLSFRYLSDDQFWFTFFHEAAHLLLHEAQLRAGLILEGVERRHTADEDAASSLAEEILFPGELRRALDRLPATTQAVIRFAIRAGVSPGLVVGQLQHRGAGFDQLSRLKRRYVWTNTG